MHVKIVVDVRNTWIPDGNDIHFNMQGWVLVGLRQAIINTDRFSFSPPKKMKLTRGEIKKAS